MDRDNSICCIGYYIYNYFMGQISIYYLPDNLRPAVSDFSTVFYQLDNKK